MMDQIEQLEQHVETLLKLLESAKTKIIELGRENEKLKTQLEQAGDLDASNQKLDAQVRQLQGEVEEKVTKESQIRERLRLILSKIDTIETELTSAGGME